MEAVGTKVRKRNEVWPSTELQQQVFPFIETVLYRPDSAQQQQWIKECNEAMMDKTPTKVEVTDDDVDPYCSDQQARGGSDNGFLSTPQHHFLLMLVRMRRIILQDAAAYITYFESRKARGSLPSGATMESLNPILNQEIFKTQVFLDFQQQVAKAIQCVEAPLPLTMDPELVRFFKTMGTTMESFSRAITGVEKGFQDFQQSQQPLQLQDEYLSQSMFLKWVDYTRQTQLEDQQRLEQLLECLQDNIICAQQIRQYQLPPPQPQPQPQQHTFQQQPCPHPYPPHQYPPQIYPPQPYLPQQYPPQPQPVLQTTGAVAGAVAGAG
ncbi:hypothetical protein MVEG_12446, partial [Podila verticillata NRRL 6337]